MRLVVIFGSIKSDFKSTLSEVRHANVWLHRCQMKEHSQKAGLISGRLHSWTFFGREHRGSRNPNGETVGHYCEKNAHPEKKRDPPLTTSFFSRWQGHTRTFPVPAKSRFWRKTVQTNSPDKRRSPWRSVAFRFSRRRLIQLIKSEKKNMTACICWWL